ncbi:class I SAM-dependent RNA methyltransferase [Candidatus Saccharibacteria bacterium]|nr:class I SAM-dependent RNA methyltransferase [Candidatus Saccharibacteria bacterium]
MKYLQVSTPVKITKLVPGGQGIGTFTGKELDSADKSPENMRLLSLVGKKGFFWNALPSETVSKFTITKNKSHYFEAIADEISETSTHRIAPKDSCFLATSPWQIMDYDYELTQKTELLKETFSQVGLDITGENVAAGPADCINLVQTDFKSYFYRNKMEYSLFWDNAEQKIKLAQHARGSHRKIPLKTSSIERPEIWQKALEIVADLNSRHEEARKYQSLLLRCNKNGDVSGGLYENGQSHPIFNNLEDKILDHTYSYSPNGFFQINLPVYEMALLEIKKHINTDNVLDLYSGVGTIGLSVARDKNLTLVESSPAAFAELEKNAKGKHHVILSKSEETLDYIAPDQTVILDPPRAGCDKKLIEKLLEVKPKTIIYLSCNPSTQARDVKLLTSTYNITSLTPFNFFPRTPHLENLIVLHIL